MLILGGVILSLINSYAISDLKKVDGWMTAIFTFAGWFVIYMASWLQNGLKYALIPYGIGVGVFTVYGLIKRR